MMTVLKLTPKVLDVISASVIDTHGHVQT